jgi:hypothetical protein
LDRKYNWLFIGFFRFNVLPISKSVFDILKDFKVYYSGSELGAVLATKNPDLREIYPNKPSFSLLRPAAKLSRVKLTLVAVRGG